MKSHRIFIIALFFLGVFSPNNGKSQILFMKDCFVGGVMTCGSDNMGSSTRQCLLKWEESYNIRAAYAITYRYNRPVPHSMRINNNEIQWDITNQAGPEQHEIVDKYFAVHAQDHYCPIKK